MGIFKIYHGLVLGIPWLLLENFALWTLKNKHKHSSPYIHGFSMTAISFCTGVGIMIELVHKGPQEIFKNFFHQFLGFVQMCLLLLILASGWICKYSQNAPSIEPKTVVFRNIGHSVFGWGMICLGKICLYSGAIIG